MPTTYMLWCILETCIMLCVSISVLLVCLFVCTSVLNSDVGTHAVYNPKLASVLGLSFAVISA